MIDWKFHANLPRSSSWLAFHGLMARPLASQMTFLTSNGLVGASAKVVRGQNIARIAKAAFYLLLGKSSLNVWSVCPGCPGFPVYTDDYDDEDPDDHDHTSYLSFLYTSKIFEE